MPVEEQLDQLPKTPEDIQSLMTSEVIQDAKVIAFEDQRGIERRPHPDAVECYASPEIQEEVGQHFMDVDQKMADLTEQVEKLLDPDTPLETGYRPLSDDFLNRLKSKVKEQLPTLTEQRAETRSHEETTGRLFKKTRTVSEQVDVEHPVTGNIVLPTDKAQTEGWAGIHQQAGWKAEYMDSEHAPDFEKVTVEKLEDLLTSDKELWNKAGRRLPLLATKIRDAGLTPEQVDKLDWAQVEELVPEAKPWFDDVHTLERSINDKVVRSTLRNIDRQVTLLGPNRWGTISTIYYDEPTLAKISGLHDRIESILAANYEAANPGKEYGYVPGKLLETMHKQIAEYFDHKPLADTILIHGTSTAPRIINSGALRPAAGMDPEEFTFNTRRTHVQGIGAGINGSRATHFADHSNGFYATNTKVTEEVMRRRLAETHNTGTDHPWVNAEIAKGGFGESAIAIRLGDLLAQSPFGGTDTVDFDSEKNKSGEPEARRGVVELTEKGWEQAQEKLTTRMGPDVAFIAAPHSRTEQEMYDYGYPLDDLLLGIPTADPDTIPQALHDIGWSDQKIAEHTFSYNRQNGQEGAILQDWAVRHPKYPRSVVVTMHMQS